MGIVYVALDTQLGREVALKVLPEFFSRDVERLQRFQHEARATSLLNHPNIVTVFEVGQMDGCEFIVTEYVEGETLRDKMTRSAIPLVETLKIASQVAGALAAAHRAGIVHRDIKPENIMLRPDGYVKVLDFGLVRAHRGDFDVVVACYHDQGLIPVKLLAFGKAVNVTLGLPIVRTSVDHGTAFDIAGKGIADPESMVSAVLLAARLARAA